MEWGDLKAGLWFIGLPLLVFFWFVGDRLRSLIFKGLGDKEIIFSYLRQFSPLEIILKRLFVGIGFTLLVFGLMQPRRLIGTHQVKTKTLNLVFALDCSYSMLAQDFKPNRLTRAKIEISSLLEHLQGDRVALVVFAGQSLIQCPLTEDYYAFKSFLSVVNEKTIPTPGTNISSALASAYSILKDASGTGVVILLTDGEDFSPNKTIQWAKKYRREGIKVYCIGIGNERGEPIPLPDGSFKRDKNGNIVLTRLDEDLLIRIAQITGGAYLRAGAGSLQVERMYRLISREHRTLNKAGVIPEYAQYYVYPLSVALILLFIAWYLPISLFGKLHSVKGILGLLFSVVVLSGWSLKDWKMNSLLRQYQKGKKEVVKELEDLRNRASTDPELNYNLGTIKAMENDKDAERFLEIASQMDSPIKARAFYNLGNYYLRHNKLRESISSYRNALILDPDYADARYNLELALKRLRSSLASSSQSKAGDKQNVRKDKSQQERKDVHRNSQPSNERKEQTKSASSGTKDDTAKSENKNRSKTGHQGPEQREGEKEHGQQSLGQTGSEGSESGKEAGLTAILSALREDELKPSQVNRRMKLRGEYHGDKDW